jgi:hypothetical protein
MDEPPYTCETSEIMNKLDMGEIPETPAKEQGYGPLDASACSVTSVRYLVDVQAASGRWDNVEVRYTEKEAREKERE